MSVKKFSIVFLVYMLLACILFPYLKWYCDNPDTFSYISISKFYLSANLPSAINASWSPLICWLLCGVLPFCSDDIVAFKILQLIVGGFMLFQWASLLSKFTLRRSYRIILIFTGILHVLSHALLNCTPDLLFEGFILLVINLLFRQKTFSSTWQLINISITGLLMYLTKAFGFPLFIFIVILNCFFNTEETKINWKNNFKIILFFLLMCSPWIAALSISQNHFTISDAAGFNLSADVIPSSGVPEKLPLLTEGLNRPLHGEISAWISPGKFVSLHLVTLFSEPSAYFRLIKRNVLSEYYFDFRNQLGIMFIILFLWGIFSKNISIKVNRKFFFITLVVFSIYAGYALVLYHERYSWVNVLLMLLMIFYLMENIPAIQRLKYLRVVLVALTFIIAVKKPYKEILFSKDGDYPLQWIYNATKYPFETMFLNYRSDRLMNDDIREIKKLNLPVGNVASFKSNVIDRDSYTSTLRISSAIHCTYFGQLNSSASPESIISELKKYGINYLITWRDNGNGYAVYSDSESGVAIYRVD